MKPGMSTDPDQPANESFPKGLEQAYWFSTFNALSYPIVLGSPMVLYAKSLNATATVLGIIAGMMPLLVLFQIPAAGFIARFGYRAFIVRGWSVRVMFIFMMGLIPFSGGFLPPTTRLVLLMSLLFCFNLSRGISSAAWLPWITTLIPETLRGKFLAREAIQVSFANFLTLLVAGWCLGHQPEGWHFGLLFMISGVMGAISLRFLRRIPDCDIPDSEKRSKQQVPWRAILLYPPFTRFLIYNAAWAVAFGGLGAFSVAYLKIAAGFPENQILALTGLSFLGGMAGLWIFRQRMDQFGSKPFILLCLIGWTIMAIAWTGFASEKFEINFMWVLVLQLGMGLGFSLINMNNTRLAMCLSPVMGRSHFFALYSVAANLVLGLSPILWGLGMDWVGDRETRWMSMTWNRYTLFFAGVAIAFVITFFSALRLSEPKSKTLDSLLRDLLFITPQRALTRLWTRS